MSEKVGHARKNKIKNKRDFLKFKHVNKNIIFKTTFYESLKA